MQEYEKMRTIFRIFKSDVKGLWRNKLALLIALAICVLPSLYAWFNIYSNWDPYSNTGTIPVAVVSVDKGYTKSDGEFVVMGDTVIDNLKENDKIGWQFVKTEDDAVDGRMDCHADYGSASFSAQLWAPEARRECCNLRRIYRILDMNDREK